jgi:uncharacterized UBP type Zn finger protein
MDAKRCSHLEAISDLGPLTREGCRACQETGDTWVALRLCLTCGHVGCCDSSKNRHARNHFKLEGHPLIRAFEPGEDWRWCYVDDAYVEPDGRLVSRPEAA